MRALLSLYLLLLAACSWAPSPYRIDIQADGKEAIAPFEDDLWRGRCYQGHAGRPGSAGRVNAVVQPE